MSKQRNRPRRGVRKSLVDAIPEAVGNAIGAFIVPLAGDPQIAQAVSAGVGAFIEVPIRASLDEIRERNGRALVSVAAGNDQSAAEFLARVAVQPELLELFLRAMRAAEATNQAGKLLALGRSLRYAADDDTRLDPETQIVRVLDRLDAVHIRILQAFDRSDDEMAQLMEANGGFIGNGQVDVLTADAIEQRSRLGNQVEAVLHELVVLGLLNEVDASKVVAWDPVPLEAVPKARRRVDWSVPVWYRTVLGSEIVDRMRLHPVEHDQQGVT